MSHHKHTAKLFFDGRTFDVHVLTMNADSRSYRPTSFDIKASEIVETTKPPAEKRADLIAFAKTGAPPALGVDFAHDQLYVYDATSQTFDALRACEAAFNEDVLPAGHQPKAPRELYGVEWDRRVPRMRESRPWRSDYGHIARPVSPADFCINFHASNQRWWTDLETGEKLDRNMGEMIMLVTSEIAEAMEGERKNLMDDHLPHRKMAEVELADAVIRIADIVGSMGRASAAVLEQRLRFIGHNDCDVPENKGEALKRICDPLAAIHHQIATRPHRSHFTANKFARVWHRIECYAKKHGYDLWGAVYEKMEYNKTRKDHTPEARKAANGKKF